MPPKKIKTGTVITTLFESEKNNNVDDSDDNDERRKKSKKDNKKDDKTFNCDICHHEDPTVPKFLSSGVKFLEEDEQIILKFKNERNLKILCKKHYKNEITNWKLMIHHQRTTLKKI